VERSVLLVAVEFLLAARRGASAGKRDRLPVAGEVLLFGGDLSEPELLIAYGPSRFASMVGPLAGNPVLTIEDRLARLIELERQILWRGAVDLRIAMYSSSCSFCSR
jgi:hypothetical protein